MMSNLSSSARLLKFAHPRTPEHMAAHDNTRFTALSFPIAQDVTVHGFAGYFEACLYKDVGFSTVPHTFSTGMFSWFPLFVPLVTPQRLCAGDRVDVNVWRCATPQRVWYEWSLGQPVVSPIHNPRGRSFWVGL